MSVPIPTPIMRFIHLDNLHIYLQRGGLHSPNTSPDDGLAYRTIHNVDIQNQRRRRQVTCGPCGVIHDYIPFYFGPLSPMMLQLKTGRVTGYEDGQEPLVYLVTTAQAVSREGISFVFSDGHGITSYTKWFDDLADLDHVDWNVVNQRYWKDTVDDMDRQRRKQAEFLIFRYCPWSLIHEIVVINRVMARNVERVLEQSKAPQGPKILVNAEWYYY